MAEIYAQIVTTLPWHEKTCGIPVADAPGAFGLYAAGLCFCQERLSDGVILKAQLPALIPGRPKDITRLAARLVAAGLWDETPEAFTVHDYLDWNKSRAEVMDLSEKRRAAGSKGGKRKASKTASTCLDGATSNYEAKPYPDTNADTDTSTQCVSSGLLESMPECLRTPIERVKWTAPDDSEHETAAGCFLHAVQIARGATPVSSRDYGLLAAAVADTCPAGCTHSVDEVEKCLKVLLRAADKTGGKPSPLFTRIVGEDR